jgi:hypothetical protein
MINHAQIALALLDAADAARAAGKLRRAAFLAAEANKHISMIVDGGVAQLAAQDFGPRSNRH